MGEWVYYLQKVQADRGNLSRHAVQGDQQYRADQPIPEDLKDQAGPERRKVAERWLYRFMDSFNNYQQTILIIGLNNQENQLRKIKRFYSL